jgi:hypothetical protein
MEAFKTDPENKKLKRNFDLMMTFFHGKDKELRDAVVKSRMRHHAAIANENEERRRRTYERIKKRDTSARKIQVWSSSKSISSLLACLTARLCCLT